MSRAERIAIVVVLLMSLVSSIGTAAYGLTHVGVVARPSVVTGAPGGPPTADERAAGTPGATPTARAKPKPRPRPRPKLTIPASGPESYVHNTRSGRTGGSSGRVITFDVRVQKGLPYDADDVAAAIATTLNDPRSWRADRRQRFRLVTRSADAELHAYLVTPDTTDRLCAPLLTRGEVSCQHGTKVVLNARRWAYAVADFDGRLQLYRDYLVNHEFGHYLGYGHVLCPGKGRRAPVMMQQTKGLKRCKANAWPYPSR